MLNYPSFFNGVSAPYQIEQSLRFNSADSANLNRTPSSTGNRRTFTVSCWVKRAQIGATQMIWSAGPSTLQNFYLYFTSTDELQLAINNETAGIVKTTAKYRDPSAWYHILTVVDTTQSTSSDRIKFYVNGELVTAFASASYPSQNLDTQWNHTEGHRIGVRNNDTSFYINAYIAEFNNLDGTAVSDAEDFGELDDNGVWRPIKYAGSYTGNSFYLKFDAADVDGDSSGLGNDWTASAGISTSGTGTDVLSDTPTTNWCTLNPVSLRASYNNDCNDGNLGIEAVGGNWDRGTKGTIGASSGKWYWEYTHGTIASGYPTADIGITKYASEISAYTSGGSASADTYLIQGDNGNKYNAGSGSSYGSSFTTGDICSIALDMDNGKVWFGKNGTWFNSGNPANGTNEAFSGLSGIFWPLFYWGLSGGTSGINQAYFNFGQRDFEYTPPTGFKALNTANLPAPDIADGSDYFNTVLWTGNGAAGRSITGLNFSPDLVWLKNRSDTYAHQLHDAVRGASSGALYSNLTNAQDPNFPLTSFDSAGFTLGDTASLAAQSQGSQNYNGNTYAAWCWDAGGSGSSNTAGSITSTVSANPSAGFSIVSYTGNSNTSATVGHGLGVVPKMIVIKKQINNTSTAANWVVYHASMGTGYAMFLNSVSPQSSGYFNTAPTSTVFQPSGGGTETNYNTDTYVAYCFAEVEGYSKFGSYTGNGSTDGPFVFCGFRPAWVLTKRTDSTSNWYLQDTTRSAYNLQKATLFPESANAEAADGGLDFLSNGFKLRNTDNSENASGGTYIFMALAENPFGGDGVSPATAR